MKKVININFQGRVLPIEEAAYESLKQYIESLRRYFAQEEGRDEIINDIESRIAELFSEKLKKGTTCITEADVDEVTRNMGRPQDFEAADAESREQAKEFHASYSSMPKSRGRLYRNADDKIIAGVASGLANYLGVDPVLVRIFFVVLFAPLFWVYVLLWIIVPSQSLQTNITKRLYRSAENKVIGGVASGLAAYFNIEPWIPRLIFALPLLVSLITGSFHLWDGMHFWLAPRFITSSLGSTLFISYIILWIAVPVATTAAEKLEMKGERIDLNSIRDTVKDDLQHLKSKAKDWGDEVKQTATEMKDHAREFGNHAGKQARQFADEVRPLAKKTSGGIVHVIGILFKAFFFFIAGIIALSLFAVLIGLLIAGYVAFPFKDFVLESNTQQLLALGFLFLFLGIPLIALMTWLVRRIMGVRSRSHYLGYTFGGLWLLGLICTGMFFSSLVSSFRYRSTAEDAVATAQPSNGKLYVKVEPDNRKFSSRISQWDWDSNWPVYGTMQDSLLLSTVKLQVQKSEDGLYHVTVVRTSRGNTVSRAHDLVEKISYPVTSTDSVLLLPKGFGISAKEKFRNQQVFVYIELPVGKKIEVSSAVKKFDFVTINVNRFKGVNVEWEEDWSDYNDWDTNTEYIMTPENGLVRITDLDPEELKRGRYKIIAGDYNDENSSYRDIKERIRKRISGNIDSVHRQIDSLQDELEKAAQEAPVTRSASATSAGLADDDNGVYQPTLHLLDRLIGR